MKVGGLQKVSLIDYPGLISSVIFLQGCNFRCSYCHNPELVEPGLFQHCIPEKEILAFLQMRRGKIDAVTVTGGEPTIQNDLSCLIKQLKEMGFAVKLDTNGSRPQVVKTLLAKKLLDFIAMDIKGPLEKYAGIAGVPVVAENIVQSIKYIRQSGIPHEFRTTIVRSQLTEKDISKIAAMIPEDRRYVLQKFIPGKTLNKKFLHEVGRAAPELEKIKKRLEKENTSVIIR